MRWTVELAWQILFFTAVVFGAGAACGPSKIASPLVRLAAGVIVALGWWFAGAFIAFACHLPNRPTALILTAATLVGLVVRRAAIAAVFRDHEVRQFFTAWLVLVAWALGLLALVVTYSGGAWVADWFEQWQRTQFFVQRGPMDEQFLGIYALTARPPLANVVIAVWLEATVGRTFADAQVFMTLLGSIVVLPVWIVARQWSKRLTTGWWLVLVLMLNPSVVENLTFAWTKLPTAAFVLLGIAFLLQSDKSSTPGTRKFAAAALGLAMVTHYSAGPWLIAIGAGYLVTRRGAWADAGFWTDLMRCAAIIALPLIVWVGWAAHAYGIRNTFGANTTVNGWHEQSTAEHLATPLRNIADTLVPFPIRGEPADGLLRQKSRLGYVRDAAFCLYQVNLPMTFGLAGLWILAIGVATRNRAPAAVAAELPHRSFFTVTIPSVIILGILVHTPRDEWGLAHICLQPLIVLGLTWIAAQLSTSARRHVAIWGALVAVDFVFGIALEVGIESGALRRFIWPGVSPERLTDMLTHTAMVNAAEKTQYHLEFLADRIHAPVGGVALWLALCVGLVIVRLRNAERQPHRL